METWLWPFAMWADCLYYVSLQDKVRVVNSTLNPCLSWHYCSPSLPSVHSLSSMNYWPGNSVCHSTLNLFQTPSADSCPCFEHVLASISAFLTWNYKMGWECWMAGFFLLKYLDKAFTGKFTFFFCFTHYSDINFRLRLCSVIITLPPPPPPRILWAAFLCNKKYSRSLGQQET